MEYKIENEFLEIFQKFKKDDFANPGSGARDDGGFVGKK